MDKSKKATRNTINKKYNKCFKYVVTVSLNPEEITKDSQRLVKIDPFIDKYNWKEQIIYQKRMIGENLKKNNLRIALKVLYAKKEKKRKYILPKFQNITQIAKNKSFF